MTIFGGGGFPARRPGGSGPPPGPDGTLPQYTTMSALDAGLTVVGRMAQLVGATTGAVALTVRRVAAGAGGLEWLSPLLLWQLTGTELDGAFAPVLLGPSAITWGTPGSRATGGITIVGNGTVQLPGWRGVSGVRRAMAADVLLTALGGTALDCMLVGLLPTGATTGDFYGGGVAFSSSVRAAASINGNPNTPGLGYGAALGGAPTANQEFELFLALTRGSNTDDSASAYANFSRIPPATGYSGSAYTLTNTASLDVALETFQPCIVKTGDFAGRFLSISNLGRIS